MNDSSKILLQQDKPIIVALVQLNSTKLSYILNKYNIMERHLPTVKFFIQKNYIDVKSIAISDEGCYLGHVESAHLCFTVGQSSGGINIVEPEVSTFMGQNVVSLVFIGQNNSESYKTFENLRQYDSEIKAASCPTCLDLVQDSLILDLNGHRSNLLAPYTKKDLYNFLDDHAWPKVMEYSMRAHERVIHLGLPALVLFTSNKLENFNQTMDLFMGLGNRTENMFFMYIVKERVGRDWERLVQYVGVTKIPGIQILDLQDKFSHFEMQDEITEENITRFIKQFQIQGVKNVGESLMQNPEVRFNPYAKKSDRFH